MTGPRIGTAGWSLPRAVRACFPADGSVLERYAAKFNAVEINSSFYRPHRMQTYERWARVTPAGFRFAVKAPRTITHEARLTDCEAVLDAFLGQARALGEKLGPILVQLPPSLAFDPTLANSFFEDLRNRFTGLVVCEPRHASWFEPQAEAVLIGHRIARAATDPAMHPAARTPGGWIGLAYWRMHGSPRIYYSAYDDNTLAAMASDLRANPAAETWCVFDNTALGAAAEDALKFQALSAE